MKPKTPPNTKALQAWQSELRRLEDRLAQWEADLGEREEVLEEQEAAFEAALENADDETVKRYSSTWEDAHDGDCGCGDEEAGGGCECPKCQNTRENWVGGADSTKVHDLNPMKFDWSMSTPPPRTRKPNPVGDEVQWLEKLFKLEDKRKKK